MPSSSMYKACSPHHFLCTRLRATMATPVVEFRGVVCALYLREGALVCQAEAKAGRGLKVCCSSGETDVLLELRQEDVIGAESVGPDALVVHYAIPKEKSKRKTRTLKATAPIKCKQQPVDSLIALIRNWALGEGKETGRKLLAISNPISGKGKATSAMNNKVNPLLEKACGFCVSCHTTRAPGDGTEIIASADLSSIDAIVFFGGDGTVHEGLQGLLSRQDWEKVCKIPMVQIPVGTGNALAASTGLWDVPTAVHAICKGVHTPLDIVSVIQGDQRCFSFLGLMYGAITTIDIGTENLRWLGEARFTMGAVKEIVKMRSYEVKIAFIPADNSQPGPHRSAAKTEETTSLIDGAASTSGVDRQNHWAALTLPESQIQGVPHEALHPDVLKWFATAQEGSVGPSGWQMLSSYDARLTTVLNLPYIALNTKFMPLATPSDGQLHIVNLPSSGSRSRMELLDVLLKSDSGEHIGLKAVETIVVKSLMLATPENRTWVTVDGEVKDLEAVYMELHPSLCTILTAP